MNVNLHELANTGGFGRADEILKKGDCIFDKPTANRA